MISYKKMCKNENFESMQKGMYQKSNNGDYSIVLLTGEFYNDISVNENIILYVGEGKNKNQTYTKNNLSFKNFIENENGKLGKHRKVKVYKKNETNIWQNLGFYDLKSTWIDKENNFKIIKFLLIKNNLVVQ